MRRLLLLFSLFLVLFCNAQPRKLILPTGFLGGISKLCFSNNEKRIYTSNFDALQVWDANSGRRLTDIFNAIFEMSDDGRFFITSSEDTLLLWDADETKILRRVKTGATKSIHVEISPDGRYLVCEINDSLIRIIQSSDLKTLREWPSGGEFKIIRISGENDRLVCLLNDKSISIRELMTGKEQIRIPPAIKMYEQIYLPKGTNKLVTVNEDQVLVRDLGTGVLLHQHQGYRVAFSPDNIYVFIATPEKGVLKTNLQTGKYLTSLNTGKYNYLYDITAAPGKDMIGVGSSDQTVTLWDTNKGELLKSFNQFDTGLRRVLFSKNGRKLITVSEDRMKVWQVESGILLTDISGHSFKSWAAITHPFQNKVLLSQNDSLAKDWNIQNGQPDLSFGRHSEKVEYSEYSPDGKKIVTVADSSALVWEAGTGRLIKKITDKDNLYYAHFSEDSTKLLTAGYHHFTIWDLAGNSKIYNQKNHQELMTNAAFYKDGKKVVSGGNDSLLIWWDAQTGEIIKGLILTAKANYVSISPDQKKVLVALSDNSIQLYDYNSNIIQQKFKGHRFDIKYVSWSHQGDKLVSASFDNTAIIWDVKTGQQLVTLPCDNNGVFTAEFSPDDKQVITCSSDNIIRIWNAADGHLISSLFSVDASGFFNILPSGYYFGSPEAAKLLHYVTPDLQIISFDQLDLKFNRPDKVLESLGNKDTALIRSYKKAWEKRVRKMGIDTIQFRDGMTVPGCEIVNKEDIEYEQKIETISLQIHAFDSTYKLDRFNVWVNETPLFGQRGVRVRPGNRNRLDTVLIIVLSQGLNRIEVSVTNSNGTESLKMQLYVNYTPSVRQKESLRFIGIGIDQFADSANNLKYSAKDIRDLAVKLKTKFGNDIIVDTLFNQQVTVENIKALKFKLLQTSVNDKVIVSYSGHGLLSKDYDYFLSTYGVNFNHPEENGLSYDELENLLDSIPARKKLLLIDACHSGEVDKEEMTKITAANDSLKQLGTKGGKPIYNSKTTLGMKNSFELMQSLFVNVGKSTGATVISAAAGTQFALERGDLKNGVFTYSILEAMDKTGVLYISELKRKVGERVIQLTKGLQQPTSRSENHSVDWRIW